MRKVGWAAQAAVIALLLSSCSMTTGPDDNADGSARSTRVPGSDGSDAQVTGATGSEQGSPGSAASASAHSSDPAAGEAPQAGAESSRADSSLPVPGDYIYEVERASAKDPVTIETAEADDFHRSTMHAAQTGKDSASTDIDRRKEGGVRTLRQLSHRPSGVISEMMVTIETDHGPVHCEWESPLTRLRLPLRQGASWQASGACSASWFGGGKDTRTISETVTVGREVEAVVEGRKYSGYVVNRRFTFESSAQGLKESGTMTELHSPELGAALQHRRVVRREFLGNISYHREESRLVRVAAP